MIVPGLLQTAEYAREVTNGLVEQIAPLSPGETKRRVEARIARQQVLKGEDSLKFSAILDESVLYRRFGNKNVMESQLEQLISLSGHANISLRILRLDGRHPIGTGAFVVLQFDEVHEVTHHDVVYLEHLTDGRYIEDEGLAFTYRRAYARLSDLSINETESRELILAAIDKWR